MDDRTDGRVLVVAEINSMQHRRLIDHSADRRSRLRRVLFAPVVQVILGILLVGCLLARWVERLGGPTTFRDRFGIWAPIVTVPVHVVVAVSPFPSDVLSVANGTLYGFWLGAALSWLGWWMAALVEFGLGRRVRRDFRLDAHVARLPTWLRRFPVYHPAFLIGSRQIPWAGGHVSTFLPGAMGVSWLRHAWCSAVAIVPSALIMSAIGVGLLKL